MARAFKVRITEDAERDLDALFRYLAEHRSPEHAAELIEAIDRKMHSLARFPERGAIPRELVDLGQREYRQVLLLPYRIIYRLIDDTVFVYLIADGRRDMKALLAQRLLGP